MTILQKMDADNIKIDRSVSGKEDALRSIAQMVANNREVKYTQQEIYEALSERENLSSTGFGNGIAIPHCSLEGLDDFLLGLLVTPQGINFDAVDKKKVKLLAFIIAPKHRRSEHIAYLSQFSRLLKQQHIVNAITKVSNPQGIKEQLDLFFSQTELIPAGLETDYVLFHIILQQHEILQDMLQILSEVSQTYLSVIEAENAGNYLHTLPLFASFWNESQKGYNKIILAAVPKKLANDVLRRISILTEEAPKSGILVMTHEITYLNGSINL
ncbi:PTS sugar transporter subunit IIA [candidate division KSB1 bacterium]|nr:PTS sugar transporter subunit IIA [candidate division KSB1 bacterium]